eukprot:1195953-Prorocentrum_minimum.AAC.7
MTALLNAALKQVRLELAKSIDKPAFCVFSNKVLDEIVARCPTTEHELLSIPGMGPAKLQQYGASILQVCRAHDTGGSATHQAQIQREATIKRSRCEGQNDEQNRICGGA